MIRDPSIPRLVSVPEAADILGQSRSRVHQLVTDGHLPAAWSGSTIVLAESTVRRYAAGERFGFPAELVIHAYDEDADAWVEHHRKQVSSDYQLPEILDTEDIGVQVAESYRVELLDNQGKTLAVKTVDTGSAS